METWFPLIDLRTQAEAVTRHVQGWTKAQILAWLSQHGEVWESNLPDSLTRELTMQQREQLEPPPYHFRSYIGIWAHFRVYDDGTFKVIW